MRPGRALLVSIRATFGRLVAEDRTTALVALGFGLTQLTTIAWDLPGSHGWENDGIAPRDLFASIAHNLSPGQGHQYPLLHCLLVAVLALPILLAAALTGPLTGAAIRERVLSTLVMTSISLIAKALAIAMACLSVLMLSRIVRRTAGVRAGRLAALFLATNLTFAFYGRVSNLDVPYLTWTLFALDAALDVIESGSSSAYRRFALFAAAAVATKDQAYACFVLVVPFYLVVPALLDGAVARKTKLLLLAKGLGVGAFAYALMSGAIVNPTGFLARYRLLSGPASQGWRGYSRDLAGLAANVGDALSAQPVYYWPLVALAVAWLGVLVALIAKPGASRLESRSARLLPFVAGLSSFLFFALPVARAEPRFILPLGVALAAYGGIGADFLLTLASRTSVGRPLLSAVRLALGIALGFSALKSSAVHLTQLGDARRQVSSWLARVPKGTRVETYGLTVYAPHFDVRPESPYRVRRVGPTRPGARNPLVGVEEVQDEIADVARRRPDVIVISDGFANAYVTPPRADGRALSGVIEERQRDQRTRAFVQSALYGALPGYRQALVARPELPAWARTLGLAPVAIQSTTGSRLWVLVRSDG